VAHSDSIWASAIKESRALVTKKKGGPNGPPFPFRFEPT
jgi:hypothetical protein